MNLPPMKEVDPEDPTRTRRYSPSKRIRAMARRQQPASVKAFARGLTESGDEATRRLARHWLAAKRGKQP